MSLIDVESVPRRTMTLFFMADTSGSMAGNKIGALNDAITNILPMISEISNTNPDAEIKIAALQFSSGTSWLYDEPKNAEDFVWQEQKASGLTSLGEACCELEKVMHRNGFMKSASGSYAPAIILLSDGGATDNFDQGIEKLKTNNWFDTYTGHLGDKKMSIGMSSNITTKFGAHISYKGIGLGYMLNLKDVFTGGRLDNRRWDGSINTSRISVEWYYTKDRSDINIHRLGSVGKNRWRTYTFQGLSREAYGAYIYYFFNHSHYCQSAAYGISRHQRRSAGSFILGLHANHQDISMDFDWLSEEMKQYLPDSLRDYRFTYRDYSVLVGYGYSWVPHRRWLVNVTAIPSLGLRHSHPTNMEGDKWMLSTNIRFKIALVLNRKKWSYGLNFISDGHWYRSSRNSFFNSSQDINISVGFRL